MFYRSANLIITSSVMGCLAIVAVALRLWAREVRRTRIGADDALLIIGLVSRFLAQLEPRLLLTIARFWRWVCVFATLSEQRNFDLETMSFTSNLVPLRAGLSPGYCLDI